MDNIISGLGRATHYGQARADDPQLVPDDDADPPPASAYAPPMREYGVGEEMLATLIDLVGALVQQGAGKRVKVPRGPRPVTADDIVRAQRRAAEQDDLVAFAAAAQARWRPDQPPTTDDGDGGGLLVTPEQLNTRSARGGA